MKLAVVGATGATGRHVVERALSLGHDVIAVSRRNPATASLREHLSFRVADVRDITSLVSALAGAEAVISAIGPDKNLSPGDLVSVGTRNIIAACHQASVPRFVLQSGITLTDGAELSVLDRYALRAIRLIYRKAIADKRIAETATRTSTLQWTIVRPAGLKDLLPTGRYIAGPQAKVGLLRPLPFADCADCLVRAAASEPEWSEQIVNVGV